MMAMVPTNFSKMLPIQILKSLYHEPASTAYAISNRRRHVLFKGKVRPRSTVHECDVITLKYVFCETQLPLVKLSIPTQAGFSGFCRPASVTYPSGHSQVYDPTVLLQTRSD